MLGDLHGGIFLFPPSLRHVVLPYLNSLSLSLTLFISPMWFLLPLSLIYFQIHHAFISYKRLCPYPFFRCNIYIRSGLCPCSHLRPGHELHLRIQPARRQPGVKGRG